MTKLISLDIDYSIKLKSQIETYLNPDFIYIPFLENKAEELIGKNVKKGSFLCDNQYTSVSGKVLGVEQCTLPDGTDIRCLAVANDFKEKSEEVFAVRKRINNLSKEEVLESIYDETLKKKLMRADVSIIVLSGIDDEPYLANETFIQKNHTQNILEVVDALLNIYPHSKAIIAIKNTDSENILTYNNFLGTYKNIELRIVDDFYLIGKEEYLMKHLSVKDNYIYLKTSEVYSLFTFLKKRKAETEKYITITGDAIDSPRVIQTKIGTKVIDLFTSFYEEDISLYDVYVNGVMQGKKLDIHRMIVTKELEGLVIMKKHKIKEKVCIKCGKCISVCPISSNPMLAYKTSKRVKCIGCGLCTYICPSYIPLYKYLSGGSDE